MTQARLKVRSVSDRKNGPANTTWAAMDEKRSTSEWWRANN